MLIHRSDLDSGQNDTYPILSTAHAELFDWLRGNRSSSCWTFDTSAEPVLVELIDDPRPTRTLLTAFALQHESSPIPFVCGGCPGMVLPRDKQTAASGQGAQLVIDLSDGIALDPRVELRELSLRIGTQYYRPVDAGILNAIRSGSLHTLVLSGIDYPDKSISIVQTLAIAGHTSEMWLARPVFIAEIK